MFQQKCFIDVIKMFAGEVTTSVCINSCCCFIDDRQENVDAAIALGMDAVLIENATTLREQFRQRGLLT